MPLDGAESAGGWPSPLPVPEADPAPAVAPARRRRAWWLVAVGAALAGLLTATVLTHQLRDTVGPGSGAAGGGLSFPVGCQADRCTGADAQDMACSVDAGSYADLTVDSAHVELRISDLCQAGWARISHAAPGDRVLVLGRDGATQVEIVGAGSNRYLPTRMVAISGHGQVRACLQRGVALWCTAWGAATRVGVVG